LKTITSKELFDPYPQLYDLIFQNQNQPTLFSCSKCNSSYEVYCSESCRENAWKSYHQTLCLGINPNIEESLVKLTKFCQQTKRRNPLMILRAFAMVSQSDNNGINPVCFFFFLSLSFFDLSLTLHFT